MRKFNKAAALGGGGSLYEANREAYRLLRYEARGKLGVEEHAQIVHLIDWRDPAANHFAVAEEVTVAGGHEAQPLPVPASSPAHLLHRARSERLGRLSC